MIIKDLDDVTQAVLSEAARAPDERFRQLLTSAVKHLHGFVRDVELTEAEFHRICAYIVKLGQQTNTSHNEVVLAAGSLGVSTLVCLLNNQRDVQRGTTASVMGPFWREHSPTTENGGCIVRSATPGTVVYVNAWFVDEDGTPVPDAHVDVWQASGEGFYENQDPGQADMNLRGQFTTDHEGHIWFSTVKPVGYPVPIAGVVGELLRAQGRHNMRPAHMHFMAHKEGYKTQFSQLYSSDDPNLDSDVQFGVTRALVVDYHLHHGEPAPDGAQLKEWYSLDCTFTLSRGKSMLPAPPITGKASGPRPQLAVLQRQDVE